MILYHGTTRDAMDSILREGLRPSRIGIVYLSPKIRYAQRFGEIVLKVDVPDDLKLTAFPDCKEWEVLCWGHVSPEAISVLTD